MLTNDGHCSHLKYGTVIKAIDNEIIILCLNQTEAMPLVSWYWCVWTTNIMLKKKKNIFK